MKPEDPKAKAAAGAKTAKKADPAPKAKTPDVLPAKKGAAPPAAALDKSKDPKKPAPVPAPATAAPAKAKKGTGKEEIDAAVTGDDNVNDFSAMGVEPMYEINGEWYLLGNRTLNNFDLSLNGITEAGLKALLDAVTVQESTNDQALISDGYVGLYRMSLHSNAFDLNHPNVVTMNTILNNRNPFFENQESDAADRNVSEAASDAGSTAGEEAAS